MVSENETAAKKNGTETKPPAYDRTGDEEDLPIRNGLYILTNKMSRTVLDLCQLFSLTYLVQVLIGPLPRS